METTVYANGWYVGESLPSKCTVILDKCMWKHETAIASTNLHSWLLTNGPNEYSAKSSGSYILLFMDTRKGHLCLMSLDSSAPLIHFQSLSWIFQSFFLSSSVSCVVIQWLPFVLLCTTMHTDLADYHTHNHA